MKPLLEDKLQVLDRYTLEAIGEVFDEQIEKVKPDIEEVDDTELGQKYRAYQQAKKIIDNTLTKIKTYKQNEATPNGFDKSK